MFTIPLSFIMFGACIYCKNISGKYRLQNFAIPFLVIVGWIFIFLPFGVVLPSISSFISNSTSIIYIYL